MSYSNDLRKKVIEFIDKGNSIADTAKVFGITKPTIYRWLKKQRYDGNLSDKPPKRPWKKIDPRLLIVFVKQHPDFTLLEYAKRFKTSAAAICRTLKKLKITRKKRLVFTKNETKPSVHYFWSRSNRMGQKI
jgi:putative transposase